MAAPRLYELEDKTWVSAEAGTVSWRNNNPGNLKFEFHGSADTNVHSSRLGEKALADAQKNYDGIVDRKLTRQADISKIELLAACWRYSHGVRSPSEA